jgi:CRISPR-associated protein Cmr5
MTKIMADNTTIKGLEQGRAKYAYKCVEDALKKFPKKQDAKEASKNAKAYKSYSKKLPMMIKTNGIGASLAFVLSKGKSDESTPWGLLYRQIHDWLKSEKKWLMGDNPSSDLSEVAINLDSQEYRALTVEVLAFLNWLRRFAEGLIEGEAEDNG